PAQILFNNLISDLPMFCISRDNVDKESLQKPQRWNTDFILKFMLFFGVISTLFDLLFICVLYFILNVGMDAFRTAWFLESVLSEIIIVFSLRTSMPFFKSIPAHLLIASSIIGAAVAIGSIYFTPVASLLRFVPLSAELLSFTAVTLVAYFALTEIGKRVFYSRFAKAHILTTPKCIN
ncbi:magnesium-translocating P-type ATPase, partial [Candidatus Micrarchaeota archaeon CG11_big_fil_rev_8_21_14_0_20_47_5]